MNDMSLKAKIRNVAAQKGIMAQAVLQNYLMNKFLFRLSKSKYKNQFVVKGGMLISSMIGIDYRTTMDIDTTIKGIPLEEEIVVEAVKSICDTKIDDDITYKYQKIEPIRDDDKYGGFRVTLHAIYGKINTPITIDISTGDIITPDVDKHTFINEIDGMEFELLSYPIETVLAEKLETILSRGTENTRPRDYYDLYMLSENEWNPQILYQAFKNTATHRGSFDKIQDTNSILEGIKNSGEMEKRWNSYRNMMNYASSIEFGETVNALEKILSQIKQN